MARDQPLRAYGSSSSLKQYSAVRLAPAARDWLATDLLSSPYQIFESVCNLLNAQGDVLSLMFTPAEMNPLALEIDCPEGHHDFTEIIRPESEIRQEADLLRIAGFTIRLDSAESWDPFPDWGAARESRQRGQDAIIDITSMLIANHSNESLAVFLRALDSSSDPAFPGWQKRAHAPITRLLEGLKAGDAATMLDGASNLAGLGMGLTPSGDDFIIGVMHALWCTLPPEEAAAYCGKLLDTVAPKTNRLSASYLARAARGESGEAWHTLIEAMAQGDTKALIDPVQSLIGLGHTSGQDALSGFVLGYRHVEPH